MRCMPRQKRTAKNSDGVKLSKKTSSAIKAKNFPRRATANNVLGFTRYARKTKIHTKRDTHIALYVIVKRRTEE